MLLLDPQLSARQEITIQLEAPGATEVRLFINDETHLLRGPPFRHRWALKPGAFTLRATVAEQTSPPVSLRVEE